MKKTVPLSLIAGFCLMTGFCNSNAMSEKMSVDEICEKIKLSTEAKKEEKREHEDFKLSLVQTQSKLLLDTDLFIDMQDCPVETPPRRSPASTNKK